MLMVMPMVDANGHADDDESTASADESTRPESWLDGQINLRTQVEERPMPMPCFLEDYCLFGAAEGRSDNASANANANGSTDADTNDDESIMALSHPGISRPIDSMNDGYNADVDKVYHGTIGK